MNWLLLKKQLKMVVIEVILTKKYRIQFAMWLKIFTSKKILLESNKLYKKFYVKRIFKIIGHKNKNKISMFEFLYNVLNVDIIINSYE